MQFLNTLLKCRQIFLSFIAVHLYFVTFYAQACGRFKGGVAVTVAVAVPV